MTLDEAIKHAEEVAFTYEKRYIQQTQGYEEAYNSAFADSCESCADEHRQLADWLGELKEYKDKLVNGCTLCKVDEAKKSMKALIKKYADNPMYDDRIEAVYECLEILKEACE